MFGQGMPQDPPRKFRTVSFEFFREPTRQSIKSLKVINPPSKWLSPLIDQEHGQPRLREP